MCVKYGLKWWVDPAGSLDFQGGAGTGINLMLDPLQVSGRDVG
jgi:hypothetical protein